MAESKPENLWVGDRNLKGLLFWDRVRLNFRHIFVKSNWHLQIKFDFLFFQIWTKYFFILEIWFLFFLKCVISSLNLWCFKIFCLMKKQKSFFQKARKKIYFFSLVQKLKFGGVKIFKKNANFKGIFFWLISHFI